MKTTNSQECCVLNSGDGAWAFEPLAAQLSRTLGIEISTRPRRFNYLLHVENQTEPFPHGSFIPQESIHLASDKRLLATAFARHGVPTPKTQLCETFVEVVQFVRANPNSEWCLKYPTSCGANGHRMVTAETPPLSNWPVPFVVQEFIRLDQPEVFRTYAAAGELFEWVARRFPQGASISPWVAHARGARYVNLKNPPKDAYAAARQALLATGLWNSFGCVDLLCKPTGEWVVLEVGTDGIFNHVDREIGDPELENELLSRVAKAFWIYAG